MFPRLHSVLTPLAATLVLGLGLPTAGWAQHAPSLHAREARDGRGPSAPGFRHPDRSPGWERGDRPQRPPRTDGFNHPDRSPGWEKGDGAPRPGRDMRRPDRPPGTPPGDRVHRPGRPDHGWRPAPRPPVWHRPVPVLPPHARPHRHHGQVYWHAGGHWYRPYGSSFVLVGAPAGLWVATLPATYHVVHHGPHTYYYADGTWYTPAPSGGYEVVEPPQEVAPLYEPPIAYPAAGQSPEQQASDEYECHAWAVQQSGFDPSAAAVGQAARDDAVLRGNYTRAYTACLEGRGYSVR